ncbi:MAG: hypothetical protein JEZ00_14770 [Anaerolineaceae bacterium]|nr:hypothetical protein [Anaerolineaceae bacterium]
MSTLLNTKFHIPKIQSGMVLRTQLIDELNSGRSGKLTLVTAPAGFGKTTLVAEWINEQVQKEDHRNVAWLSLDDGDNSLHQFWIYVVGAIQNIVPSLGISCQAGLQASTSAPIETILISLINDLCTYSGFLCLVLDDYHEIQSEVIHESLAFFIDRLPHNCHLVIVTRVDPPISIPRLRVRGQITEIRAESLRFTKNEIVNFFSHDLAYALNDHDIELLAKRTEGWIAGIQLASLSLKNAQNKSTFIEAFSGSHRFLVDYLVEEILSRQSAAIQRFLWRTCILERFCTEVCNELVEESNAQQTLRHLEQENLFIIALDDERRWYRYHHLFSEFLSLYLQENEPEIIPALYKKAIDWFTANQYPGDALHYAIKLQDFEHAADLIEQIAPNILENENHMRLMQWINQLPESVINQRPYLCVYLIWVYVLSGKMDIASTLLDQVERLHKTLSGKDSKIIQGHICAHRAYILFLQGNYQTTIEYANQALAYLPDTEITLRTRTIICLGNAQNYSGELALAKITLQKAIALSKEIKSLSLATFSFCSMGEILRDEGHLTEALEMYQALLNLAEEITGTQELPYTGFAIFETGVIARERNELDSALTQIKRGVRLCREWFQGEALGIGLLELAETYRLRGEYSKAEATLAEAQEVAGKISPWAENLVGGMYCRLYLSRGEIDKAIQWVSRSDLIDESCDIGYERFPECPGLFRTLVKMGKATEALERIDLLIKRDKSCGRMGRLLDLLVLKYVCLYLLDKKNDAIEVLTEAVCMAADERFIRPFLDERSLIEACLPNVPQSTFRDELLMVCSNQITYSVIEQDTLLIEPLNEREIEIIQLMATGKSNREISDVLYLSVNTIRWYASQIYMKLGVKSRGEAVAQVRELNIL